ncbi:MAG: T9SS type A sorting domain-containing protein [Balneolales bacterium]|nr:T9SS type A sorting domain-containing protein [Balneolales bacterium]
MIDTLPSYALSKILLLLFFFLSSALVSQNASAQTYIEISTPQQLSDIRNNLNGNYKIVADIDLSGFNNNNWSPIGNSSNPFTGQLISENGSKILNLRINRSGTDNVGFFSFIENATIRGISFENVDIVGRNEVGALTAQIRTNSSNVTTTIEDVHILSGTVVGSRKVAGLVGRVDQSGSVNVSVTATIKNSSNAADITSTANEAGGIIGGIEMRADRVIIRETNNTGDVTVSGWSIGGLVGFGANAHIIRSYSTGTITSNAGGGARTGGLAGLLTGNGLIEESYFAGSVVMNSSVSGAGGLIGIVGRGGDGAINVQVIRSYSVAEISSAAPNVGGLIGRIDAANGSTVEINTVYAAGTINSTASNIGGLIGNIENSNTVTVTTAYWDEETTGQSSSAGGGTPLQTIQMKGVAVLDNMPGFAFTGESSNWWFREREEDVLSDGTRWISYPYLRHSSIRQVPAAGSEMVFFAAGEGTEDDPYIIGNWKDLNDIGLYLNAHFELAGNLTAGSAGYSVYASSNANNGKGWNRLGNSGSPFRGVLRGAEGQQPVIRDLNINRPDENNVGLFWRIQDATIEGITFSRASITGNSFLGVVASLAFNSIFENVHFDDIQITAESSNGLVAGVLNDSEVRNSTFNNIQVDGAHNSSIVAGQFNRTTIEDVSFQDIEVNGRNNTGVVSGILDDSIIRNLTFENVNLSGTTSVAIIAGTATQAANNPMGSLIENTHVLSGSVQGGGTAVAGLLASINQDNVSIENATRIVNSSNAATIHSPSGAVGGLIGNIHIATPRVVITDSFNTGTIISSGFQRVGGLVGFGPNIHIKNSFFSGSISTGNSVRVGGLVGLITGDALIEESYASGTIFANGTNYVAGGLVGDTYIGTASGSLLSQVEIRHAYSVIDIVGINTSNNVGGLIGYIRDDATDSIYSLENVYAAGLVSNRTTTRGGLIGFIDSSGEQLVTVDGAYWDRDTTGQTDAYRDDRFEDTSKSNTEMKTQSTFAGWDFDEIWTMENIDGTGLVSYPYLQTHSYDDIFTDSAQNPVPGLAYIWSGEQNTSFSNAGNWYSINPPASGYSIVIPDHDETGNYPELDMAIELNEISFDTNTSFTISSQGALTLKSHVFGPEQFIVESGGLFNNQGSAAPVSMTFHRDLEGEEGWRFISSPAAVNLSDLLDPIWTQGLTGNPASGNTSNGIPNVYRWGDVAGDDREDWLPVTDLDINVEAGDGFLVYVFADDNYNGIPDPFPKKIQVTGSEFASGFSRSTNSQDSEGWTILGNPFGTSISFEELRGDNAITNSVYAWSPHDGGSWLTYNTTGNGDLTDGLIAPFHAFFVQNDNATSVSLEFTNEIKTSATPPFHNRPVASGLIRMELAGEGLRNSTWININSEGSLEEKTYGDTWQLTPLAVDYALLATEKPGTGLLDIGNFPAGDELEIPLHAHVTRPGTYTISVTDYDASGIDFYLHDALTGQSVPVVDGMNYTFSAEQTAEKSVRNPFEVIAQDLQKQTKSPARFTISTGVSTSTPVNDLPGTIALDQNYPNPFNPTTQIRYHLPEEANVRLEVFNVMGQRVATLQNGHQTPGTHNIAFDGSRLASGMYIYRLQVLNRNGNTAGNTVLTRKMMLIK